MIDHHVLLEILEIVTTEARYSRDDRGSRYSKRRQRFKIPETDRGSRDGGNDREHTTVTCADCNVECTVPFVPRSTDKPVYCSDWFRKYKPDAKIQLNLC